MNKLTPKGYQEIIAKALREVYGDTLVESDLDLLMAESVVRILQPYLNFSQNNLYKNKDFCENRKKELIEEGCQENMFEVKNPKCGMSINVHKVKH